jgi:hypothetical protein
VIRKSTWNKPKAQVYFVCEIAYVPKYEADLRYGVKTLSLCILENLSITMIIDYPIMHDILRVIDT